MTSHIVVAAGSLLAGMGLMFVLHGHPKPSITVLPLPAGPAQKEIAIAAVTPAKVPERVLIYLDRCAMDLSYYRTLVKEKVYPRITHDKR